MALYAYEEGIPAAIKMITNEIKEIGSKKTRARPRSNLQGKEPIKTRRF